MNKELMRPCASARQKPSRRSSEPLETQGGVRNGFWTQPLRRYGHPETERFGEINQLVRAENYWIERSDWLGSGQPL
jgi:hypothetical protein